MPSSAAAVLPLNTPFSQRLSTTLASWRKAALERRALTVAMLLAFTSIVAAVDYATGDEIPLMILYLPAIIAACWMQHVSLGVALSLVCSSLWLIDDVFRVEQSGPLPSEYWLAVVHMVFFTVIAVTTWRLRLAQERQQQLARTDALTQLPNRKAFLEAADREIARARRAGGPLAIAYLDCDNFKQVNDTEGHAAGDALLVALAEVAAASVRPTDVVARLGGDEFACLLPAAPAPQARQFVLLLQQRLNDEMRRRDWPVTFSIGLAVFQAIPSSVDELIGAADELMYEVKAGAKNSLLVRKFLGE